MNATEMRRELSDIIKLLNKLKFKFAGLDYYAGGDQTLSYAKDGVQIDITTPEDRPAEL
jgi:hypothetical protein